MIPSYKIWWLSQSPPPTNVFIFQANFSGTPSKSFQSFQWSPLLVSQLWLIPPFVLLKINWSPPQNPPPPQTINNDRSLTRENDHSLTSFSLVPNKDLRLYFLKISCRKRRRWHFRDPKFKTFLLGEHAHRLPQVWQRGYNFHMLLFWGDKVFMQLTDAPPPHPSPPWDEINDRPLGHHAFHKPMYTFCMLREMRCLVPDFPQGQGKGDA